MLNALLENIFKLKNGSKKLKVLRVFFKNINSVRFQFSIFLIYRYVCVRVCVCVCVCVCANVCAFTHTQIY